MDSRSFQDHRFVPGSAARAARPRRGPRRIGVITTGVCLLALASGASAQNVISLSPDVTIELGAGNLVTPDDAVAVDNQQGVVALQNLGVIPGGADVIAYAEGSGTRIFFAVDSTVALTGGLVARPGDVVALNGVTYSIAFSALGAGLPPGIRTDAVALSSTGGLLLSFDTAVSLPGALHVADEDLVRWNGTTFSLALDGSTAGIADGNDVDAVDDLGPSTFLVSFESAGTIQGISFADEDVLRYASGAWSLHRDGSAADADWRPADLDAMQLVPEPGAAGLLVTGMLGLAGLARFRRTESTRAGNGPRSIDRDLRWIAASGIALISILIDLPAQASEGVIEIHQTCATTGGCFPGDAAGFPVTITASGSYRLSSNLTIPNTTSTAIDVNAEQVSIDLNGFAIIGQTVCSGTPLVCTPSLGSGYGVDAGGFGFVRVVNGSVRGMGNAGLFLGNDAEVANVRATSNRGGGIQVNQRSRIVGSIAAENDGGGITFGSGSIVANTVSANNSGIGIFAGSSTTSGIVTGNVSYQNDYGIRMDSFDGVARQNTVCESRFDGILVGQGFEVSGNTVYSNTRNGLATTGGWKSGFTDNVVSGNSVADVQTGQGTFVDRGGNSCGGTTSCP